ncbi:MAG: P1 family peptidase [Burkholderiales bacterium]|nr:P1 family peptidase [Burkholderiales bacterium]
MHPGSLTDIAGLKVGHHTDTRRPTGCTVVLCEQGATCGVDVRGAAPGTRETDLLNPVNTIEQVHAVLLCGGSAFGLAAADGVMRWLEGHGHGVPVGPARVPIVPAAVLFDLWVGDAAIRPDSAAGHAACEAARATAPAQGSVGAGAGASVGKLFGIEHAMKGGIGSASLTVGAITVGALVAVNAIGDVVDPRSGRILAGARADDGRTPRDSMAAIRSGALPDRLLAGMATTIGVVATDARLTKAQANKLASMAHDGLARCINPVHTPTDGDTLFALATGGAAKPGNMTVLGALAAEVTARAVLNAVTAAHGLREPFLPSARELGLL